MEDEIFDISSDSSNSTIIVSNEPLDLHNKNTISSTESELDNLFKKYLKDDSSETNQNTEFVASNSSPKQQDIADIIPIPEDISDKFNESFSDNDLKIFKNSNNSNSDVEPEDYLKFSLESSEEEIEPIPKRSNTCDIGKKQKTKVLREQKQIEKEALKKQKLEEREKKNDEKRKNKALSSALLNQYKSIKPENCLKFIKVNVHEEVTKQSFWNDVAEELRKNDVSFKVKVQEIPCISWTRDLNSCILNSNGELIDTSEEIKINEILIIIDGNDFINKVHDGTFSSFINNLRIKLLGKKIILAILGLEKYFKFQKQLKTQELRKEILDKVFKNVKDLPKVTRRTVEYVLTEIQLFHSISHRMFENSNQIALFVFQLTKSIAQAPYKQEKYEKFIKAKWFMAEDNKNSIRVDKTGNGLLRLWKQIIVTFPLANLEIAEAISAVYPSPLSLMKAYDDVSNANEGEKLLQNIPIRRTAGPLSVMRKIGPEMSKKIYNFFTSIDPEKML